MRWRRSTCATTCCRASSTPRRRSRRTHRRSGTRRPDNIAAEIRHGDAAAAAKAFASAAHVVALELVNQRLAPCPIEPRALLASYDAANERITLRASSQTPAGLRDTLCGEVLGIAADKVRVRRRRRRRRLRNEDGTLSRGRRARVLRSRVGASAQVVRRAHRRVSRGLARTGPHEQGRARARCVRPRARAARIVARQPRRVRDARRRRHPVADRAVGVDQHLRHSDHRHSHQGRAHAHESDGRLPRRRAARGDLSHRAPDGLRPRGSSASIRRSSGGGT